MENKAGRTERVVFIKKDFSFFFNPEKLKPLPHTPVNQSSKYFNTHYFKATVHSLVHFTSHTAAKT